MSTALPILTTARLTIRPLALTDLSVSHQLLDQEAWQTGQSLAERRVWLEWTLANYAALANLYQPPYGERGVVLQATGELIGMVGVVPALGPFDRLPSYGGHSAAEHYRPEFGLFWAMRTAHRGQGYAAEAARAVIDFLFSTFHLARIVATTEADNAASQAVMRRLGMRLERNPRPEPAWFQVVGVLANPAFPV